MASFGHCGQDAVVLVAPKDYLPDESTGNEFLKPLDLFWQSKKEDDETTRLTCPAKVARKLAETFIPAIISDMLFPRFRAKIPRGGKLLLSSTNGHAVSCRRTVAESVIVGGWRAQRKVEDSQVKRSLRRRRVG